MPCSTGLPDVLQSTPEAMTRQNSWSRNSSDLTSHSHAVITVHPARRSAASLWQSRCTFLSNFERQNSTRVPGTVANLHPACRCQKHPWTNTAARWRGNTRSGVPGKVRTWTRNRRPAACRYRLTTNSGAVSLPLMPAIIRERTLAETTSGMTVRHAGGERST